ncbi:hypothetical protein HOLleu_27879 [Holothuria leucospilota]|uniref:Uncharacterized protein n=1 Tax=Holothuria leucospilota TaxID=206669 RepID=A0A9Q1BRC2_HOLLE|nr:hypothetical protein HOLleu_27879 [Holothuria leucospilota]
MLYLFFRALPVHEKKKNSVLGLIKRNFSSFSKEIVLNLYKQLVRPHLDYAAQAWSPFYEKDKFLLEQVQRRATRLIPEVKHLPYHVRLKHLGLTILELRRILLLLLSDHGDTSKGLYYTAHASGVP